MEQCKILALSAFGKTVTMALSQNYESHLDRVSTGSGSDLVNDDVKNRQEYRMLIIDQVATAPCTDPAQDPIL